MNTSPQIDATGRVPGGERALVLGGGGSAGNAWLIGVLAGLFDAAEDERSLATGDTSRSVDMR